MVPLRGRLTSHDSVLPLSRTHGTTSLLVACCIVVRIVLMITDSQRVACFYPKNEIQYEIVDNSRHQTSPRCRHLANWTKYNEQTDVTCVDASKWSDAYTLLSENMTKSTKPKVHNILHRCQSRIEPWPQLTCTENFMKIDMVSRYTSKQTDTQTR